jgi:hypothetical protein
MYIHPYIDKDHHAAPRPRRYPLTEGRVGNISFEMIVIFSATQTPGVASTEA